MTARRDLHPVDGTPPVTTYGPERLTGGQFEKAMGRFLDGLRDGEIWGRECRSCRRILVPPRMFCEECFRSTDRWVRVEDTGTVNTFSICYIRWDMVELKEPELPFVLEIDGASPMMGFMHKLGEVDPDQIHVGMEVEAVWRPESERTGSILDIRYFRPRKASLRRATRAKKTSAKKTSRRKSPAARKRRAG
jgi:uncharacterized OB-fold protein